jgi:hypothetical protein
VRLVHSGARLIDAAMGAVTTGIARPGATDGGVVV